MAWGKLTLGGIVSFALEATWADVTPLPSLGAQTLESLLHTLQEPGPGVHLTLSTLH